MKATLALQQSGLKSVCVGSTWPWKKRIKTLLDCSMQNIKIFHFVVLESVLERSLMVSSLCSQCVAALQGKDKLGTSEDAEEIPALNGGEMSPVLRSQYQTGVYHGLTYKSHDQVKKCTSLPFLFFMTLSHVDCSFFLKFLLERFWLWVFLGFFGKQDFVISLTESEVSSLRLKYQQSWREWSGYFTWLRMCCIEPQGHVNQPSASLGTGAIGQDHVQTESTAQLRGCLLCDIKHF